MPEPPPPPTFVALGHAGSGHYAGIETFPNPGVARVELTSDELTAVCPITGQPDMYVVTIAYEPAAAVFHSHGEPLARHLRRTLRDLPTVAAALIGFGQQVGARKRKPRPLPR